eukprot:CAMPEP_0196666500 /NCGR_PEP_ID=MMETSP1086-20130531/64545_1 /TAXON_ID=77921 /ORGANISM="Cyanoptyche  gloeocystis , Strain SAG4.97" /LENGTH=117 /DNA_ID=CAMNT_0042003695 /DNA_START=550 /DNA_END=903 /DNA_ORIENTATION=+
MHAVVVGLEEREGVQQPRDHLRHGVQRGGQEVIDVRHAVADEVVRSTALQNRLKIWRVLRDNGLLDLLRGLGDIGKQQLHGVVPHICDALLVHIALRSLDRIFAVEPVLSGQMTHNG